MNQRLIALGFLLAVAALPSTAQIRIGQTAGFTGQASAGVAEITQGARLYFDAVNARGGVNGQKIELVSMDDRFDAPTTRSNAQALADDPKVLALFLSRGTPHTQAMLPVLEQHRIALVAPSAGAMQLHRPVQPYVFNVRASYQREARRAIEHLKLIGISRIAVIYPDDSFGQDAVAGASEGFKATGLAPLLQEKFEQKHPDFAGVVEKLRQLDVQAALFIGSGQAVAQGTRLMREKGVNAQVITLSNNASHGFIESMGPHARGVIITQVFPNERSIAYPLVKEAAAHAKAAGHAGLSPAVLEGYAGAKVLVEGLRHAGRAPTRASLIDALNKLGRIDLGGMALDYSPSDHTGLDFVDMSIVDWKGSLLR
jgi:branched-chain amino acid transport system substrate-binding protein